LLPKLNVMTVNKLLGGLDGCGVVLAIQIYGFHEMTVTTNDVSAIMGHVMHPLGKGGSMQRSQSPMTAKDIAVILIL
jgi:hypothetical protein